MKRRPGFTMTDESRRPILGWWLASHSPLWLCRVFAFLRIYRRAMVIRFLVRGMMPGMTAPPRKWFSLDRR